MLKKVMNILDFRTALTKHQLKQEDPSWWPDIEKEAARVWEQGHTANYMGVYISPFGEHIVIPIRDQDIDKAIQALQELKEKGEEC